MKNIIIAALVVLAGVLLFTTCTKTKQLQALQVKLEDTVFKVRNELNQEIALKEIQISDNQRSMKKLREELFNTTDKYNNKVLEVKALIAQKTKVRIDSVYVPYVDTVKMKQWSDTILSNCRDVIQYYEDSTVLIDTHAVDSTQHYTIDATIQKDGIRVNNIELIDSQYISVTKFKGGFLKKDEGKLRFHVKRKIKIEVLHTNPYFKNIGLDGVLYEEPNKHLFIKGLGTGIGLILLGLILIK